jgi:flagellar basal-body rod protein FlgG
MKALQIAASGMTAQQMRVDVISNNLAQSSRTCIISKSPGPER